MMENPIPRKLSGPLPWSIPHPVASVENPWSAAVPPTTSPKNLPYDAQTVIPRWSVLWGNVPAGEENVERLISVWLILHTPRRAGTGSRILLIATIAMQSMTILVMQKLTQKLV